MYPTTSSKQTPIATFVTDAVQHEPCNQSKSARYSVSKKGLYHTNAVYPSNDVTHQSWVPGIPACVPGSRRLLLSVSIPRPFFLPNTTSECEAPIRSTNGRDVRYHKHAVHSTHRKRNRAITRKVGWHSRGYENSGAVTPKPV